MGATLADGGVNPSHRASAWSMPTTCRYTLAVMTTAGLYETSGDWLYDVGLPGKSGIGGGIVTVAPGKGGLGTFSPLLDAAGNSVKGSSPPGSCPGDSGWTCSLRGRTQTRRTLRSAGLVAVLSPRRGAARGRRPRRRDRARGALRAGGATCRAGSGLRVRRVVRADRRRPALRRADRRSPRPVGPAT